MFLIPTTVIKYLSIIPIAAAVLGFCFDLGTFTALGLAHYPLFGLGEHLLFALATGPFVFVSVLTLGVIFGVSALSLMVPHAGSLPGTKAQIAGFVLWALPLAFAFYDEVQDRSHVTAVTLVFIGVALVALARACFMLPELRIPILGAFAALVTLTSVFYYGLRVGRSLLRVEPVYSVTFKNAQPVKGTALKFGDRGVLIFVHSESEIQFHRWEFIESISRRAMVGRAN